VLDRFMGQCFFSEFEMSNCTAFPTDPNLPTYLNTIGIVITGIMSFIHYIHAMHWDKICIANPKVDTEKINQ
jgi:hypothetical protein